MNVECTVRSCDIQNSLFDIQEVVRYSRRLINRNDQRHKDVSQPVLGALEKAKQRPADDRVAALC